MKTMNLMKRSADERGQTELGWLHGRHTFSFGEYYDPNNMGFRSLRVINDDVIEPGGGFGTHPHRDMEIFTYVIEGELEHKDSLGNGRVIQAGDLQYMSAGSGVRHSEFNPSADRQTHLLQIWIQPQQPGGAPRYAELKLGSAAKSDALTPLFAGQHRADAEFYFGKLAAGKSLTIPVKASSGVWIHVISGKLTINGAILGSGDGAGIEDVTELKTNATQDAEFLAFVLA
ncbi:MAG: Quercetin 2,3-dioxygenase [Verrucomicrobiae bacterium]|nr:Quercetin 2,3-dioxygenase [Verrucomicrobiae bacterium]